MNRFYRLIWSKALQAWVCCAENAKESGKSSSTRKLIIGVVAFANSALLVTTALAAPAGGQIIAGSGVIAQNGNTTTISQASQNLSVNWKSFNIAVNETVNFVQPSAAAIAVNRISSTNGSQILGHLNANGQIYLINPNGIIFGAGAQVNVGGLVASTLDISSNNNGVVSFTGSGTGSIVNQGVINAANGGYVAFIGNAVSNTGTIAVPQGAVGLASGNAVSLTFADNRLLKIQVDQSVLNSLASNGGLIKADGGMVILTAGARDTLLASVVNNTGIIEAQTVSDRNGTITLLGGMIAGTVNVGGTLDASAPAGGNGGLIETSAERVALANDAKITTAASSGLTGTWLIDPVDFTIAASDGDMTGAQLSNDLSYNSVILQSSSGGAGTAGDINVNDVVNWSTNLLTLKAQHNININAAMTATGTASLSLQYGLGAIALNNTSNLITGANGMVNLPTGTTNFTTLQGSDGVQKTYTVITSLGAAGSTTANDLQGINGNLAGNYVLGANIAAAATSTWNSGAGFTPIGGATPLLLPLKPLPPGTPLAPSSPFSGIFDGLGHTISNLSINMPIQDAGLFGNTSGTIRNVGMTGGNIACYLGIVGELAGNNTGTISNSYAAGSVSGSNNAGGLVGTNHGMVDNSYATGMVNDPGNNIGGLAGANYGTINNSYASGSVVGTSYVGGLAGYDYLGTISNSYAKASVNRTSIGGGQVACNTGGPISNAYATGSVTGTNYVGGLAGYNQGNTISNSYWKTTATTTGIGGGTSTGATGLTSAQMQRQTNFSTWNFTHGTSTWTIYEGLSNPLLTSFLTPLTVTANGGSTTTYNGLMQTLGNGVTYSAIPNSNLLGTLNYTGGGINVGSYAITPTGLYSNQQGYLISYVSATLTIGKANATVTGNSGSVTYNGLSQSINGFTATGLVNGETASVLTGVTASGSGTNAGNYSVVATGTDSNYNLAFNNGTLSITPATLTYVANTATMLTGNAVPALNGTVTGFVNNEKLASVTSGTERFTTPANSASAAGSYAINGGGLTANNGNYLFVQAAGNATALTVLPATSGATTPAVIYSFLGSQFAPPLTSPTIELQSTGSTGAGGDEPSGMDNPLGTTGIIVNVIEDGISLPDQL